MISGDGAIPVSLFIDGNEVDTPENPHIDTLLETMLEQLFPDGPIDCTA